MHLRWRQAAASNVAGAGRAGTATRCQVWCTIAISRHPESLARRPQIAHEQHPKIAAEQHPKIAHESSTGSTSFATALAWSSSPFGRIPHCPSALELCPSALELDLLAGPRPPCRLRVCGLKAVSTEQCCNFCFYWCFSDGVCHGNMTMSTWW